MMKHLKKHFKKHGQKYGLGLLGGIILALAVGGIALFNSQGKASAQVVPPVNYSWQAVGKKGFSAGTPSYMALAIDSNNIPYAAYADSAYGFKATVMKYANGSWVAVGNPGFSAGWNFYTSIAIDSNNIPYVAYQDMANGGKATVMKYANGSWVAVGNPGFSAGDVFFTSIAIDSNDVPYVTYMESINSVGKATVMKYANGLWVSVGTPRFSAGSAYYTSIAIDSNNIPYVAYKDYVNGRKATVMKFENNSWILVGNAGFSAGENHYTSLAIDSNNIPYVAYVDAAYGGKATVMKYANGSWVAVGNPGFSAAGITVHASDTSRLLAIDSNNIPYVAYQDMANGGKATVMKFVNGLWVSVGNPGFSDGNVYFTSIAIDSNDVPYMLYRDVANGYKATVMKYDEITDTDGDGCKDSIENLFATNGLNFNLVNIKDISCILNSDGSITINGTNIITNGGVSYTLPVGSTVPGGTLSLSSISIGQKGGAAISGVQLSGGTTKTISFHGDAQNSKVCVMDADIGVEITPINQNTCTMSNQKKQINCSQAGTTTSFTASTWYDNIARNLTCTSIPLGGGDFLTTVEGLVHSAARAFPDEDGDGVADGYDQCPGVVGTIEGQGCPAGLRISVQEIDASIPKVINQKDYPLITKIFNADSDCVTTIGAQPENYSRIFTECEAEITKRETYSYMDANNKPRNYTGDLVTFGLMPGNKFVIVQSEPNYDPNTREATYGYMGFDVPNLLDGQSRDVGFNVVPGQDTFIQTSIFTKNSKGIRQSERRAQVIKGSELQIFQPDYVLWNETQQIYPFLFISDSDWNVDVCLEVPEGYTVAGGGCIQTFVANEVKVIEFTAIDVGSPKFFDAVAKFNVTHKGKKTKVDLKVKSINPKAGQKKAK